MIHLSRFLHVPTGKFLPRRPPFPGSTDYWERRYTQNGTSGAGSYGRLANFKAGVLNDFVAFHSIESVLEFGCGDGNQLSLSKYPNYHGVDVSRKAISLCKVRFAGDDHKKFSVLDHTSELRAELVLSLDVIYHLIEDSVYREHMSSLFKSAQRFVCIYSTNENSRKGKPTSHVKHRNFTAELGTESLEFELLEVIHNPYPRQFGRSRSTTDAQFYFYKRVTAS